MGLLPVYNRQGIAAWAEVDDDDYEWLNQWRWSFGGSQGHPRPTVNRSGGSRDALHRLIMGLNRGDPLQVDHIDRNRLNNKRSNLRLATAAQNCQNQGSRDGSSSFFRGVSYYKRTGRWQAYVRLNGRQHNLGYFATENEAARVAADWRLHHMPYAQE